MQHKYGLLCPRPHKLELGAGELLLTREPKVQLEGLEDAPAATYLRRLCGSAGLNVLPGPKQRHKAQLWGMYVAPAMQRRHVGAALVRAAIEHARTRVAVVQLVVLQANTAAQALYRGFGFVSYGVEKRALRYQGIDHDDELMALDLGNGL